ncbi:MAG TPA: 50S ribosomal protein L25 [Lachnospiraceae bacterium]|nr:50S ribosomal protein L25 [Lachnospiraceae bacterium]
MSEIMIEAIERVKKNGRFKESGFVPGVLYGEGITDRTLVKYNEKSLTKILDRYGSNTKLGIQYNGSEKYGFVKEVQRQPLTGKVIHIDVQIASRESEVKRKISIVFQGEEGLRMGQLALRVNKAEVLAFGTMELMPETITIDVSNMQLGDTITYQDLKLNDKLISEDEDVIFAIVANIKSKNVEITDEENEIA